MLKNGMLIRRKFGDQLSTKYTIIMDGTVMQGMKVFERKVEKKLMMQSI